MATTENPAGAEWCEQPEITARFSLPRTRIYSLAAAGAIKTAKLGRQRLYEVDSIRRLLDAGGTAANGHGEPR